MYKKLYLNITGYYLLQPIISNKYSFIILFGDISNIFTGINGIINNTVFSVNIVIIYDIFTSFLGYFKVIFLGFSIH